MNKKWLQIEKKVNDRLKYNLLIIAENHLEHQYKGIAFQIGEK